MLTFSEEADGLGVAGVPAAEVAVGFPEFCDRSVSTYLGKDGCCAYDWLVPVCMVALQYSDWVGDEVPDFEAEALRVRV